MPQSIDPERIYTSLGRLEESHRTQENTLTEIKGLLVKHDDRLDSLETTRTRLRGMAAAITAAFTAFVALFVDTN